MLKDCKREEKRFTVFKEDKRKEIIEEVNTLYEKAREIASDLSSKEDVETSELYQLQILEKSIFMNKRCMLAYLNHRIGLLEKMRWEIGFVPEGLANNLNQLEEQYFNEYSDLLGNYQAAVGIDLTENYTQPPQQPKIYVQVMTDYEGPSFIYGKIILKKGKRLYLNRTDAEHLIKHGVLQHIHN
uniref:DNA replication complex GINS protein PSF1 n=1 Tax=Arcella intermedia TaxID=1963864 RepID=A0A6B2LKC7_9EUKA